MPAFLYGFDCDVFSVLNFWAGCSWSKVRKRVPPALGAVAKRVWNPRGASAKLPGELSEVDRCSGRQWHGGERLGNGGLQVASSTV